MAKDNANSSYITWIDLELSNLILENSHILEIACLITNANLEIVSKDFNVVIHQSDGILNNMSKWCMTNHQNNGLIDKCRSSRVTLAEAENMLVNHLKHYIPEGTCPLAGNTIYVDRAFINRYMPLVDKYLHYRIIDVSSIKELVKRWYPRVYENSPKKIMCHRALPDLKESIAELSYYKQSVFVP